MVVSIQGSDSPKPAQYGIRNSIFLVSLVFLMLLLGAQGICLAQQDAPFIATVDCTEIALNETVTLDLTLSGSMRSSAQPSFPTLDDWRIAGNSQSSQFSVVGGKTSAQIVYTYRLQPQSTGDLVIPSISINIDGQTFSSQPITIVVSASNGQASGQDANESQPRSSSANDTRSLFVQATVDNDHPYLGQQIVYSFKLFQAVRLSTQPHLSWPEWSGFLSADLNPNEQFQTEVNGQSYLVTVVSKALFPTTAELMTIPPATLQIPGDLFNQGFDLKTNSVDVSVRPLPSGAPAGFAGAVGQFEINAQVTSAQTTAYEPIMLTVRIQGQGNINALADPLAKQIDTWQGWRVFDPEVTTNTQIEGNAITGERRFERPVVPQSAGSLVIPAIALDYFGPVAEEYRHTQTEPIVVQVKENPQNDEPIIVHGDRQQDVALLRADIRHIKPAPASLRIRREFVWRQPGFWFLAALPPLALLSAWLYQRRQHKLLGDLAGIRSLRAFRMANDTLAQARRHDKHDPDTLYTSIEKALTGYLADKLNVSASGLVRSSILDALRAKSVPDSIIQDTLSILDLTDTGRFAPTHHRENDLHLLQRTEQVLAALEESLS